MVNTSLNKKSITISIPCYNDLNSLKELLSDIEKYLTKRTDYSFKILFVNDGSIDGTKEFLNELVNSNPNYYVIHHSVNKGFGITFETAFTTPKTDFVYFIPGDNQFPVDNLEYLLPFLADNDIVLGKRINRKDSSFRRFSSFIYNLLVSLKSGKRIRDVNSILVLKRSVFESISLKSDSAYINAELITKAIKQGFNVQEVAISHNSRKFGIGSGGKLSIIFFTIKDLLFINS